MATIGSMLSFLVGIDTKQFDDGLKKTETKINGFASKTSATMDNLSVNTKNNILSLVKTFAAPVLGMMTATAVVKSYFSEVSQVAQLTGAYSTKLEEWRKKQAMIQRINKEDIELYKKSREALTKFQIAMSDFSANLMRKASPAIKFCIEWLNKFSDWIDRNKNNIIRFASVLATVITVALVPAFTKLALAMLANPLTWIAIAIGAIIVVIDDFITYLRGGESALSDFWSLFGDSETILNFFKDAWKGILIVINYLVDYFKQYLKFFTSFFNTLAKSAVIRKVITDLKDAFIALFSLIKIGVVKSYEFLSSIGVNLENLGKVASFIGRVIAKCFETCFASIRVLWTAIYGLFTGDFSKLKEAWQDYLQVVESIYGKFGAKVKAFWNSVVEILKNTPKVIADMLSKMIDMIVEKIKQIPKLITSAISSVSDKIKSLLPDFSFNLFGDGSKEPSSEQISNLNNAISNNTRNTINNNKETTVNIQTNNADVAKAVVMQAENYSDPSMTYSAVN